MSRASDFTPPGARRGTTVRCMFLDAIRWKKVDTEEVAQRHALIDISMDSVSLEDLYGDTPEQFFVHSGDIVLDGLVHLTEGGRTVYVIEGDLTINGSFAFEGGSDNTALYVTGSLRAHSVLCRSSAELFVGGSLIVRDLLVAMLDDAGHLVVHGDTSARAWLELRGRGAIYLSMAPTARLIGTKTSGENGSPYFESEGEDAAGALVPTLLKDGVAWEAALRDAFIEGRPLLK